MRARWRTLGRLGAVLLAGAVVAGCGTNAAAKKTLFDFTSSYSGNTSNFATPSSWQLIYNWDCSQQHAQGHTSANHFSFVLYNADDDSTAAGANTEVNRTGTSGGATINYKRNGIYYLSINSECKYRMRVLNPNA